VVPRPANLVCVRQRGGQSIDEPSYQPASHFGTRNPWARVKHSSPCSLRIRHMECSVATIPRPGEFPFAHIRFGRAVRGSSRSSIHETMLVSSLVFHLPCPPLRGTRIGDVLSWLFSPLYVFSSMYISAPEVRPPTVKPYVLFVHLLLHGAQRPVSPSALHNFSSEHC
jgi:hypothetical protein